MLFTVKKCLAIKYYDLQEAFHAGIHSQIILALKEIGINHAVTRSLGDMYSRLKVRVRLCDKLS